MFENTNKRLAALTSLKKARAAAGLPTNMRSLSRAMWVKCSPIRVAMHNKSVSFEKLGELTGVDEKTIRNFANGKRLPEPRTLRLVAQALGEEPATLWAQHVDWLAFEPTLDAAAVEAGARGGRRYCSPIYLAARARSMRLKHISELTGVAPRTIRDACVNEYHSPKLTTLGPIAKCLNVDIGKLVEALGVWQEAFQGEPLDEHLAISATIEPKIREILGLDTTDKLD